MSTLHPRRRSAGAHLVSLAAAALLLALPSTAPAQGTDDIAAVRIALEKYKDPIVAVNEGYLSTLACMTYPAGGGEGPVKFGPGAMGVHFINMGNIGPKLDVAKPQVLIYQPVGDKLELVAAEWFMPAELAAGVAPVILGRTLDGPMPGHKPIMPAGLQHYDLHVWLWKDNPAGMFSPTNAAVSCPAGATYTYAEHPAH